jgi:hypothetical protein
MLRTLSIGLHALLLSQPAGASSSDAHSSLEVSICCPSQPSHPHTPFAGKPVRKYEPLVRLPIFHGRSRAVPMAPGVETLSHQDTACSVTCGAQHSVDDPVVAYSAMIAERAPDLTRNTWEAILPRQER